MSDAEARFGRLIFAVEKSMQYHRRHARFISTCSRFVTFASALSGTAVVVALFSTSSKVATALGVLVAILGTMQLVFDLDGKVRENEHALRDFTRLRKNINDCPVIDDTQVVGWENTRREFESVFVAELDALNVSCHNIICEARGNTASLRYINPLQRAFIHVVSWQPEFPLLVDRTRAKTKPEAAPAA